MQEQPHGATVGGETKVCDFCQSLIPVKATRCRYCRGALSNTTSTDKKGFKIINKQTLVSGANVTTVWVKLTSPYIISVVRQNRPDDPVMLEKEPMIEADQMFTMLDLLRTYFSGGLRGANQGLMALKELTTWLEKEYEERKKLYEEMLKKGDIIFEALQYYFSRGKRIVGSEGKYLVASKVNTSSYERSMFSYFFQMKGDVIKTNGDHFFATQHSFVVPHFKGMRKLSSLPVKLVDDETLALLTERGKLFNSVGKGSHYLAFKGTMRWKSERRGFITQWKADGRIMVDCGSFNKINPSYIEYSANQHDLYGGRQQGSGEEITTVPEEDWYRTWPTIGGFSFAVKKWGEIPIGNAFEITFDDEAYKRLVLPEKKKELIEALVKHSDNTFADVISGKGAGSVFLLHGPPGTGKTLTAEAIAEMLRKPLYSITVGELGTTTDVLETKLRDILDVASVWDAVILMDEADVFLERRSKSDINRNAMVGIFLRLLEYHQGILFLTTNRVEYFDEAFYSRITVGLKYPQLDIDARIKVWQNFLDMAKIDNVNGPELAKHELNGRQIRSVIRLAMAVAKKQDRTLVQQDIEDTIDVTKQFREDINAAAVESNII